MRRVQNGIERTRKNSRSIAKVKTDHRVTIANHHSTAGAEVGRIENKKRVLRFDEGTRRRLHAEDIKRRVEAGECNGIATDAGKPRLAGVEAQGHAVVELASERHQLVSLHAVQVEPARDGLEIDKAELGQLPTQRVKDELPMFGRQRRNKSVFFDGAAKIFKKKQPEIFRLFGIVEACKVVIKVIPNDIKVWPRKFEILRTDAGSAENVKDGAVLETEEAG